MKIAFLLTSPYQLFHYKEIARHLPGFVTVLIENRDKDYGLTESFILSYMPTCEIKTVHQKDLNRLDGLYDAIICQTPILPNTFLKQTYVIAEQYSMAKESYQYGIWRAQAHLNLMYGPYSKNKVDSFCYAVAAGNPMLDPYFSDDHSDDLNKDAKKAEPPDRPNILYLPTYGELSSLAYASKTLEAIKCNLTIKLHHAEDRQIVEKLPDQFSIVYSDADPIKLLKWAHVVVADFSGSAYDAIYTGKPLVLIKKPLDQESRDYKRLSDEEKNYHLLHEIAAVWDGKQSFDACLKEAMTKIDQHDHYDQLTSQLFVNRGSAGKACAEAIINLIENGEPPHFARDQIRASVRGNIIKNRSLNRQIGKMQNNKLSIRKRLAKVSFLKKVYQKLKGIEQTKPIKKDVSQSKAIRLQLDDDLGKTPLERKQSVKKLLSAHFKRHSIEYAVFTYPDSANIDFAISEKQKPELYQSFDHLSGPLKALDLYLPKIKSADKRVSAQELSYQQLENQAWLKAGVPLSGINDNLSSAVYVKLVFTHDENGRIFTIDTHNKRQTGQKRF